MIKRDPKVCLECKQLYYKKPHSTHKQFDKSTLCSWKCHWEVKKRQEGFWLGKKRLGLKLPQYWKPGKDHPYWKGGVSRLALETRHSYEYATWRKIVLKRDKKCIWCGGAKQLQVDHIKSFREFPNLRFDPINGRVLCFNCHKQTPSYGFFPKKEGFYA